LETKYLKPMGKTTKMAIVAWLLVLLYYFYQYALRSTPVVMIPQLSQVFGLNAPGVASIIGMFYYGYSPFSLITGVCNFITFTFSALLSPVFGWIQVRECAGAGQFIMKNYQLTFTPIIIGVGLAIILAFFLKETGQTIMKKQ
jgi:hypothetical protein